MTTDEGARAGLLEVGRSADEAAAVASHPLDAPELARGPEALEAEIARLQRILLLREELLAHSAHDLRGMVNTILITVDLLLESTGSVLTAPQHAIADKIKLQGRRLVELITRQKDGHAVVSVDHAAPLAPAAPPGPAEQPSPAAPGPDGQPSPAAIRPRVLIIDDDEPAREAIARQLEQRGYAVRGLGDADAAVEEIRRDPPDLALLDVRLPGMDGFALAEHLARDPRTAEVPILFLSAWDAVEDRIRGLALGADDFLTKPVDDRELAARVERSLRHATQNRQLRAEAGLDGLTRIANYRVFCERLKDEQERAQQRREPLSLVVLDVDGLKSLNDEHGHEAGNRALQDLGAALAAGARRADSVARYGGDEFVALLPGTKPADALGFAERILADFTARVAARHASCTVSAGVASLADGSSGASLDLFAQADAALYRAKHAGGARAELAPPAPAGSPEAGT